MKKLLIVAALALASVFGGMSAANAGLEVCYDINVNGTTAADCETVEAPALP